MSAFAGVVHLDGTPVSSATVGEMLERLHHRVDEEGWNARSTRTDGAVAFGSAVLEATPTARFEREHPDLALSLTLADGSRLWLAGDVRLDGRPTLEAKLQLSEASQEWSDGRLVLEAYAHWDEDCLDELKGDFAFVIWDEARQKIFCARDRFGVRPFYFAFIPGVLFAFASEIKALWPALPFAPRPNKTHIAHYLASEFVSFSSTFYEGIDRLPPARTLILQLEPSATPLQSTYFELDAEHEVQLGSDEEAAQQLRGAFSDAVRERTRCAGRLATFLSGGLDSSSVAAVAVREAPAKNPLLALSMVFARFKECDEQPWIEKNLALAGTSLEREWVWGDDIGALNDIERVVWHLDGPPLGPNTCSTWTQYAPLQRAGVHVVLDGHGGDEVVFLGYQRVNELAQQRRYAEARRELLLLRRNGITRTSATPLLWAHLQQRARGTRFIGRFARTLTRLLDARASRKTVSSPSRPTETQEALAVVNELLLLDKRSLLPSPSQSNEKTVRAAHAGVLSGALQPVALESMDALAGAHAIEVRVPFWEENMVRLCLSFPSDQKLRDGWNRWVMRRAMEGLLPSEVQWRRAKTNFAPQMIHGLRHVEQARVEEQLRQPGRLGEWLDVARARVLWDELQTLPLDSARASSIAFALWRFLALGAWLQELETSAD